MFLGCKRVCGVVALLVGVLALTSQTWAAEPTHCLEFFKKSSAVAEKAAEASQQAGKAAEKARATGTLEGAREAKEAAEMARDAAEEAKMVAENARAMECLDAADQAERAAKQADKAAGEVEEEVTRIVNLLEGLKPVFLDPGTSEAERYQQEKDVSPSQ